MIRNQSRFYELTARQRDAVRAAAEAEAVRVCLMCFVTYETEFDQFGRALKTTTCPVCRLRDGLEVEVVQ